MNNAFTVHNYLNIPRMNAVNEEAVGLFLSREIPFLKIGELVRKSLDRLPEMPL